MALSAETTPAAAELTPQAPVVGESVSVVAAEVARVSLLGGLPWGPLVNSPALWVAAAAARRQIGVDSLEDEVAVAENSTPAGLALPTAAVNNRVPTLNKPKVGKPDAATGVVTGVVSGKDADKDPLTFSASVGPVKGSVVVDAATGAFTYTPTAEARHAAAKSGAPASAKSDSFTVSVDDGFGGVATRVVTVSVLGKNAAPTVAGTTTVGVPDADGVVSGNLGALDADGDVLSFKASAKKGVVDVAADGSFTFTPTAAARHAASAVGAKASVTSETFTVTVTDGFGGSVTKSVTVSIKPANVVPVISDVTVRTPNSKGVVSGNVVASDVVDKDKLTYASAGVASGKVSVNAKTGAFTYTPSAATRHAAAGGGPVTETITFTVTDGHSGAVTRSVVVEIKPANAVPTTSVKVGKPNAATGVVTGVVSAKDADKDPLTFEATTGPVKGSVVIDAQTGAFTYTPTAEARHAAAKSGAPASAKSDSFTVSVDDGFGGVATRLVTVSVLGKNAVPTVAGTTTVGAPDADGVVSGNLGALDADGDALSFKASAKKGVVDVAADGTFTFTPTAAARHAASAVGAKASVTSETFTVTVTDGFGGSVTKSVTVSIKPANVVPVISDVTVRTPNSKGVVSGNVVASDVVDKDKLTYASAGVASGKVSVNAKTGAFTYTPSAATRHAAAGGGPVTETITFTVTDGHGGVATRSVVVAIAKANAVPTTSVKVNKPDAVTGVVTGVVSAKDADKDPLTFETSKGPLKGSVVLDATTGAFTYTPSAAARHAAAAKGAPASAKSDSFEVSVEDGFGGVATRVVTVSISPKASTASAGVSVLGTVSIAGRSYDGYISADGTRALVSTVTGDDETGYTTTFTLVNATSGTKLGNAVSLAGESDWLAFTEDSSKAVVTTYTWDDETETVITRVAVINATNGTRVGSVLTLAGSIDDGDSLQFTNNDTRAVLITHSYEYDDDTGESFDKTRITVVNLTNGTRAGSTWVFGSPDVDYSFVSPVVWEFNADRSRVVVTATAIGEFGDPLTEVHIINTSTGTKVGAGLTANGFSYSPTQLSADGTRAVFAYTDNSQSSGVVVLNLITGAQIGNTLTVEGQAAAQLNSNGSRVIINSAYFDPSDGSAVARISVFNASTGVQIGSTVSVAGAGALLPAQFNADETRAIITAYIFDEEAEGQIGGVRIVVIDTATGAQVGNAVSVAGRPVGLDTSDPENFQLPWATWISPNGTRALVTTIDEDKTNVAVINTTTGLQLGTTLALTGTIEYTNVGGELLVEPPAFSDDGSRIFLSTFTSGSTRFTILNTATGAQVGTTVTLAGGLSDWGYEYTTVLAGDRAAFLTFDGDDETGYTTRMAIVNTVTGAQLGSTRTFTGSWVASATFGVEGTRITVGVRTASTETTDATLNISVFDTSTGAQVGTTLAFSGSEDAWVIWDADADRALAFTSAGSTSSVDAIDLATGTRIGSTLNLSGNVWTTSINFDGTRAVAALRNANGTTTVSTLQISRDGNPPANGAVTNVSTNPTTGVVTGTVSATDPDGDALTYSGPATTDKGTLSVNPSTGAFTFSPTAAARHAALTSDIAAKTETFTVRVTDTKGNVLNVPVTVTIQPGSNANPASVNASVGIPNAVTGVATGTFTASDADGDTLTFSAPTATAKGGALYISGSSFTYVPTEAARIAAGATGAPASAKQDSFTVTVTDGHGGSATKLVTLTIAPKSTGTPTTVTTVGTVTVDGSAQAAYLNPSGSRAVIATVSSGLDSVTFTVINTLTGSKVGNTVTLAGTVPRSVQFSEDGSRAVLVVGEEAFGEATVALVNTVTGTQLGGTFSVLNDAGPFLGNPAQLNADGTRLAIVSIDLGSGGTPLSRVRLINTGNGAVVYDSNSVSGTASAVAFSGDGKVAASVLSDGVESTVRFLNATTGAQIGAPLTTTGYSVASLNHNGSKAVVTDYELNSDTTFGSRVALYTVGGSQIGTTIVIPGLLAMVPASFSSDGTRAAVTVFAVETDDNDLPTYRTGLVLLNTSTGAQVGSTILVSGFPGTLSENATFTGASFNSSGTRVLLTTSGAAFTEDVFESDVVTIVVDAITGVQVGDTITASGSQVETRFSDDGTRVLVVTRMQDDSGMFTTHASLIDTVTGTVSYELDSSGTFPVGVHLSADGARLLVAEYDGEVTTVSLLNSITGNQIGSTETIAGISGDRLQFSADGNLVVVTTVESDGDTARLVVIDTVTGTQIGGTVILAGTPTFAARISDDGATIFASTVEVVAGEAVSTAKVLKIT
ncbi:hypothetical protein BRW64_27470 [Mycolicibacterium diernhoferi]|nr:hypothetical protein BRW64_27470 [Mycolicibacterium diernhoferi]